MDFADIIRPSVGSKPHPDESNTRSPKEVVQNSADYKGCDLDELLAFAAFGRQSEQPPRSISEEEVHKIAISSTRRTKGETFATQDEREQGPISPMPDDAINSKPEISDRLSERQCTELRPLIKLFNSCFSDGSTIGNVDPYTFRAKIELIGPLFPPQQNRPVVPGKRAVMDQKINSLLGWDVIEPSNSPTASAIVLV